LLDISPCWVVSMRLLQTKNMSFPQEFFQRSKVRMQSKTSLFLFPNDIS
jgi:hypothetical protein